MAHISSVLFVVATMVGCRHDAGDSFDPRVSRTLPGDEACHVVGMQKYLPWEDAVWSQL